MIGWENRLRTGQARGALVAATRRPGAAPRGMTMVVLVMGLCATSQGQTQEQRLTPADAITSDVFGYDVDFDGQTIVGGAPFGTHSGFTQPGRAYVFARNGGVWIQTQKLQPTPLQNNAFFGVAVAVDGDVIAIGAPGEDVPQSNGGAVYVFERVGGVWQQVARLVPADVVASAGFGSAVAVRGTTVLIGAPGDSNAGGNFAGAVYVYERVGGVWSQQQKILSPDPDFDDNFGEGLAFDGDRAVVGAIDDDHSGVTDAGAAYVMERSGGWWSVTTKLTAPNPTGASLFGECVTLSGDAVAVGAHRQPVSGMSNAGAAYVFRKGPAGWEHAVTLTAADAAAGDHFGVDVSLSGARLLVGSYLSATGSGTGNVYAYERVGAEWVSAGKFASADSGGILFGWRLAVVDERAAIAGPFYLTNRGAVYVFGGLAACPEDLDQDGAIGQGDLAQLLAAYQVDDGGDITGDGVTDQADLAQLLAAYGAVCP